MGNTGKSIVGIILALGLIGFVIYGINNFSKDPSKSTFSKIVVDIIGVLLVIGGIAGIFHAAKVIKRG